MNMDMLHAAVNSQDVKNGLDSWPPADSRRTLVLINNVKLQGGGGERRGAISIRQLGEEGGNSRNDRIQRKKKRHKAPIV